MDIEYEATFINVSKDTVRATLTKNQGVLVRPEYMQKRVVFFLPTGHQIAGGWLRVRDEGDKITLSLKAVDGNNITDQKENCIVVNSFENATRLLESIGCTKKAYQESKRELWKIDNVEITIDEWPFLEPFVEIEGPDERSVRNVANILGFEWTAAKFCAVGSLYSEKYGFPEEVVNDKTPVLLFDMDNPFTTYWAP